MQSASHSLNITVANPILRNNDVRVTLQWPEEAGAVYRVSVLPAISYTELTKAMSHNTIMINVTISYNIQYNVSIVSSLCGVTTTKVLNYGKYVIKLAYNRLLPHSPENKPPPLFDLQVLA